MASRQVALIHRINVGRAKRVAMADLRALMKDLGYRDCRTLLTRVRVSGAVLGVSLPAISTRRVANSMTNNTAESRKPGTGPHLHREEIRGGEHVPACF